MLNVSNLVPIAIDAAAATTMVLIHTDSAKSPASGTLYIELRPQIQIGRADRLPAATVTTRYRLGSLVGGFGAMQLAEAGA